MIDDAPSQVIDRRRRREAPNVEGKTRPSQEFATGTSGRQARHLIQTDESMVPPRPYFPTAPQYHAYLVLSSQLEPSEEEKLSALLGSSLGGPGRPAPILSILHLPKQAR